MGKAIFAMALYDFHMHTFFSDGELSPTELTRRAIVRGYTALAITDHASAANLGSLIEQISRDAELVKEYWDFTVLPGVELTHIPPKSIPVLARKAKEYGAKIVVVHGETIVEPVPPATNLASVECPDVDILAHPGLLTLEEAKIAAETGVFLELTSRGGHSLGNGLVARLAKETGARLIVDSDTHAPRDIHTLELARSVALGSGLSVEEADTILTENPLLLLNRLGVV
jgi:histidinol phosphatase-like PHP family hydrolase